MSLMKFILFLVAIITLTTLVCVEGSVGTSLLRSDNNIPVHNEGPYRAGSQNQHLQIAVIDLVNSNFEADSSIATWDYMCPTGWTCSQTSSDPKVLKPVIAKYSDPAWGTGSGDQGCRRYYAGMQVDTTRGDHLDSTEQLSQMFDVPQLTCVSISFSARTRPNVAVRAGISIYLDSNKVFSKARLTTSFSMYSSDIVCYPAAQSVKLVLSTILCDGDCTVEFDLITVDTYDIPTASPTASPTTASPTTDPTGMNM